MTTIGSPVRILAGPRAGRVGTVVGVKAWAALGMVVGVEAAGLVLWHRIDELEALDA